MRWLKMLLVLSLISATCESFAQNDKFLLLNHDMLKPEFENRIVKYGFGESRQNWNPMYHVLSSSMFVYQYVISQQIFKQCAYSPTCSAYSKDLIKEYGLIKGTFCTADRLMRCNRLSLVDKPSYYFETTDRKIHEHVDRYQIHKISIKILAIIVLALFQAKQAKPQSLKPDFDFVTYLLGNEMRTEAVSLLDNLHCNSLLDGSCDSLSYLKGWSYYSLKMLDEATFHFEKVSDKSVFYRKSTYFNALSNAHKGDYDRAMLCLDGLSDTTELFYFEKSGISLLNNDLESFRTYSEYFSFDNYALAEQERVLMKIGENMSKYKKKSPWLAGAASAIVPGLGKVYCGSIGEGVSSFLLVGSFAAITAENWSKYGFLNWKTLLFGSIGTVFYVGSIYGSVASVRVCYDDYENEKNISVLYSIHIPIRTIFN